MIYPYRKLDRYPGLHSGEAPIWESFMDAHPDRYNEVWYDTLVGAAKDIPPQYTTEIQGMWNQVTKKRIDVVGARFGRLSIIEVKTMVLLGAFGQLLGYRSLLRKADPHIIIEDLLLIAPYIDQDNLVVCRDLRVSWWTPHGEHFYSDSP
jgi:hypothetical protein